MQLPIKRRRDFIDKAVTAVRDLGGKFGDGTRAVGRMWPNDMRLECAQIELDHAIVVRLGICLDFRVRHQQVLMLFMSGTRHSRPVARR